jgi:hypothetical protein
MKKQFEDAEFQFGLEIALGAASRQASDVGESLATVDRIADGDADSWVNEWTATAELSQAAGAEAEAAGRRVSALSYYRRARSKTIAEAAAWELARGAGADSRLTTVNPG